MCVKEWKLACKVNPCRPLVLRFNSLVISGHFAVVASQSSLESRRIIDKCISLADVNGSSSSKRRWWRRWWFVMYWLKPRRILDSILADVNEEIIFVIQIKVDGFKTQYLNTDAKVRFVNLLWWVFAVAEEQEVESKRIKTPSCSQREIVLDLWIISVTTDRMVEETWIFPGSCRNALIPPFLPTLDTHLTSNLFHN